MISLPISGGGAVGVPNPETALAVATLILGTTAAFLRFRRAGWWERPAALLARRRRAALLSICAAPLLLRALLLPWHPVPEPRIHDEFSLLLAADTFAHGRLVNPQHPFWPHFESMHVLSRPVYASAFPVAPAAALAAGQALFGHPWIGVWLSVGLMCGALFWMLEGWLPPRWALLGAFLVVIRLSVSSYWMNSYWGGAVAATGGALVLGALPRIRRRARPLHGLVLGAGLAILANSRPFEGAVFGLAASAILLLPAPRPAILRRALLPAMLVLAFTAAGMGYYFARLTGRPWLPPYVLYRSAMSSAPHFVFQSPRPEPLYNNREMRFFYSGWEIHHYLRARRAPLSDLAGKFGAYWRFYLGPLLTIPLLALPTLRNNRDARRLLLLAAVFWLALAVQVWHNAHYAAPAAGLFVLITMLCLRRLRLWHWRTRPVGLYLVRCLPAACLAMLLLQIGTAAGNPAAPDAAGAGWRWPAARSPRTRLLTQLERAGGRHLVFIRYGVPHDPGNEWAYNDAEIDASPVVWARELDRASNTALLRYFTDRRVWLVEPDQPAPRLIPYSEAVPRPMPFVPVGAPGIAVLRSPSELRSRLHPEDSTPRTCDAWNRLFTAATGVDGPANRSGCGDPAGPTTFEHPSPAADPVRDLPVAAHKAHAPSVRDLPVTPSTAPAPSVRSDLPVAPPKAPALTAPGALPAAPPTGSARSVPGDLPVASSSAPAPSVRNDLPVAPFKAHALTAAGALPVAPSRNPAPSVLGNLPVAPPKAHALTAPGDLPVAPSTAAALSSPGDPARLLTFEEWFTWLCRKDLDGFPQQ